MKRIAPIERLEALAKDRYWVLLWLGPVQPRAETTSEFAVMVLFGQVREDYDFKEPLHLIHHLDENSRAWVDLSISLLPILHPFTVWKNGLICFHAVPFWESFEVAVGGLRDSPVGHRDWVDNSGISSPGTGWPLIPYDQYPIPEFGGVHGSPCLRLPIGEPEDRRFLLIPCLEVARFYYGNSSRLCREMFASLLGDPALSKESWDRSDSHFDRLYDPHASVTYLNEDLTASIQLRKGMHLADARVIARLAFSKSARSGFRRIHESYIRNLHSGRGGVVEAVFPFAGITKLHVGGLWLQSGPVDELPMYHFLVFALGRCSFPFPYTQLDVSGVGPVRMEQRRGSGNLSGSGEEDRTREGEPAKPRKRLGKISQKGEPSLKRSKVAFHLPGDRFEDLSRIPMRIHRPKPILVSGASDGDKQIVSIIGGTGEGTYGDSSLHPVEIVYDSNPIAKPVDWSQLRTRFQEFVLAVQRVADMDGLELVWRAPQGVGEVDAVHGISPLEADDEHTRPRWCYVDARVRRRRHVMIAELSSSHHYAYILEIERKPKSKDSFSFLIFSRNDGCELTDQELITVLRACAKHKGVWRRKAAADLTGYRWSARNHPVSPQKDQAPDEFVRNSSQILQEAVALLLNLDNRAYKSSREQGNLF